MQIPRLVLSVLLCLAWGSVAARADPVRGAQRAQQTGGSPLEGTWLPLSAEGWNHSLLPEIRSSKLTVHSNSFALSKYRDLAKDVTGAFSIEPTANPSTIDLQSDAIDFSPNGSPVKYPPALVPGIFKIEGDVLTVCFATGENPNRPARFAASPAGTILLVLRRAGPGLTDYPSQVTVTVLNPDGSPAPNQSVVGFMMFGPDRQNPKAPPQWKYYHVRTTAPSGRVTLPYEEFTELGVHDTARKLVGCVTASPALLARNASATIRLEPECLVSGKLVSDVLAKAGKPIGWTNVYVMKDGLRIGACESNSGDYQFPLAPGEYTLNAYGDNVRTRVLPMTVPAGQAEFHPPAIELDATALELMKGHPAPELAGVVAWKGMPVKLADLRGKYVLIDFWGYWCGPCVHDMPVLIQLHDKYKDKGLAILSVHIDIDGEVDTAARLDEKTAEYRQKLWNGRDLPFPTALSSGKRTPHGSNGLTAEQYGIYSYPTTVLIDREGNVVDEFDASEIKAASAQIAAYLRSHK